MAMLEAGRSMLFYQRFAFPLAAVLEKIFEPLLSEPVKVISFVQLNAT